MSSNNNNETGDGGEFEDDLKQDNQHLDVGGSNEENPPASSTLEEGTGTHLERYKKIVATATVVIGIIVCIIVLPITTKQKKNQSSALTRPSPPVPRIPTSAPFKKSPSIPTPSFQYPSIPTPSFQYPSIPTPSFQYPSASLSLFEFLAANSFDGGTALLNFGSSQRRAWTWLEQSSLYYSAPDYIVLQFYALAVFFIATYHTLENTTWLKENGEYDFCVEVTVNCNGGTDIKVLNISSSLLHGSIQPEIGLLTSLSYLGLSKNSFTGTLPTEIGLLTSLNFLSLYGNSFIL